MRLSQHFHTLSHKATFAVLGNIRKRVCEKLTRVPLGTVLDMPSGTLKNVLVERIDSIETTMAHIIPEFLFWYISLYWIGGWLWLC